MNIVLCFLVVVNLIAVSRGTDDESDKKCLSIYDIDPEILDGFTQQKFIEILTDSCHYDRLIIPKESSPVPVYLKLKLDHMEASDKTSFNAYMVLQYRFVDPRLRYKNRSPKRQIIHGLELLKDKIWIPHLSIKNEKATDISGFAGQDVFLSISPDGEVVYSFRMIVNFYCTMYLAKFPFDSQECWLSWGTWNYNISKLKLSWDEENAVMPATTLHLTEFAIKSITTTSDIITGTFTKGNLVGNFSELSVKFELYREIGYYIMDYFLPSVLLVCTAWVTFWLQADAGPPRATLGASTVVAFITLNIGLGSGIPKVSYIKASDIWFLACSFFIFGSLVEFAFVNVIWRRKKIVELKKSTPKHIFKAAVTPRVARKEARKAASMNSIYRYKSSDSVDEKIPTHLLTVSSINSLVDSVNSGDGLVPSDVSIAMPEEVDASKLAQSWDTMTPQEVAIWIDRKARIVFPVAFLIFNVFYWCFVLLL